MILAFSFPSSLRKRTENRKYKKVIRIQFVRNEKMDFERVYLLRVTPYSAIWHESKTQKITLLFSLSLECLVYVLQPDFPGALADETLFHMMG